MALVMLVINWFKNQFFRLFLSSHFEIDISAVIRRPEIFLSQRFLSAKEYRCQANTHFQRNQNFKIRGNNVKKFNLRLAQNYFKQAATERKTAEKLNEKAAAVQLLENYRKHPNVYTLDLHHLYKTEALKALHIFLHKSLDWLKQSRGIAQELIIITGQGNHSYDHTPILKPAVVDRLKKLNLKVIEDNPGRFRTTIDSNLEWRLRLHKILTLLTFKDILIIVACLVVFFLFLSDFVAKL